MIGPYSREVTEVVMVFWLVGIVACCALCAYGINAAVRRRKYRRDAARLSPR
jgi:hypothetical protein